MKEAKTKIIVVFVAMLAVFTSPIIYANPTVESLCPFVEADDDGKGDKLIEDQIVEFRWNVTDIEKGGEYPKNTQFRVRSNGHGQITKFKYKKKINDKLSSFKFRKGTTPHYISKGNKLLITFSISEKGKKHRHLAKFCFDTGASPIFAYDIDDAVINPVKPIMDDIGGKIADAHGRGSGTGN